MVRGDREAACSGKKVYLTYSAARGSARFVIRRFGERVSPYRCRYCGRWHLGGRI